MHGYDGMTNYYDVRLKCSRQTMLRESEDYSFTEAMLEDMTALSTAVQAFAPDVIVHLAAQAGVRYSIDNPRAYVDSNLVGTFNVMECARAAGVLHLLMASTSSVYGANTHMPFVETDKTETPLTFYAATKKANEMMAHSYAHIHNLPITMFRFFTVYGPWGRPDMAYFKFAECIRKGIPIDVYNNGEMWRDFTFVDDLAEGIVRLMDAVPVRPATHDSISVGDSLSPVAPYRVVNIGNSDKVKLIDFIEALEDELGLKAVRNYLPMQPGDVPATWADCTLLQNLTGRRAQTGFRDGIRQFVAWYYEYAKTELTDTSMGADVRHSGTMK